MAEVTKNPVENIQPKLTTLNINRLSWQQMFNDSKGKTDSALISAFLITVCGCGGFMWSIAKMYDAGITGSAIFAGGAAAIYTARRFSNDKEISEDVASNVVNPVVTAKVE